MGYVRTAGMSMAGRRRRRRAAWILTFLFLILLGAGVYGIGYLQGWWGGTPAGTTQGQTPGDDQTSTAPPALPDPADIAVNVYNTTERAGLANRTGEAVGALGYQVGDVGNEPTGETADGVGVVRFGPEGADAAQVVQEQLAPDAELVEVDREDATVDLLLGPDFVELEPEGEGEENGEGDGGEGEGGG